MDNFYCAVRNDSLYETDTFRLQRVETGRPQIQDDTKKRELLKNPTKIEEIQEKKLLTEIEPLQLAFQERAIQIINV